MSSATQPGWRRASRAAAACALLAALVACSPKPPVRLGFLGGLSNHASSFSEEGRNGAILAIEQRNLAGGAGGRPMELMAQDYGEAPGDATTAFNSLKDAGVIAIIGPYSSAAAAELDPVADKAQLLLLSPISRVSAQAGEGGHLVRVGRVRRHETQAVAGMLHARGIRRVAMASDMRSAAYSTAWIADFRQAFIALGGAAVVEVPFGLDADMPFSGIARQLLASDPQAVVFVSSGVDAARLAQQVARLAPALPMTASGRAINASLVELGGRAVEGMVLVQPYDAEDTSPRFRAFHDDYVARFGQSPTYSAVISFDAVNALAEALAKRGPGQSPRDALFQHAPYQGLQQPIGFDSMGDAAHEAYFSVVRNGRFESLP